MTPRFSEAVDPIFLHVLGLVERIAPGGVHAPEEEKAKIRGYLDQAEAKLGRGEEWELTKYALVAWIDELLVESPWEGREWWKNNVLEMDLFNTRECNEQFYVKAQEASSLMNRDALEVYYVCVVLGFRGLYRDPVSAAIVTEALNLPAELETWAKRTSMAIALGQGRPPLDSTGGEGPGAPPLDGQSLLIWSALFGVILLAANFIYALIFLGHELGLR